MSKNDERILALKAQIDEKRKSLAKAKKFVPTTNCSLDFEGSRWNIHTLDESATMFLLVKLNALKLSANDLKLEKRMFLFGYTLGDWIEDLQARLAVLSVKAEESELKRLQDKLEGMLSDDKKTELELDEITALLSKKAE